MNKAFIFDMDGVIINSESVWAKYVKDFYTDLFGAKLYQSMNIDWMGATTDMIYDKALQHGFTMPKEEFLKKYDKQALFVYSLSTPTGDINKLLKKLTDLNFKIGLVSASRQLWIDTALTKIKNKNLFTYILSLDVRKDLKPKPYPDGFLEAIKQLGSVPEKTIILEDSNKGLLAAKASGAFTICLREHLPDGHVSEKADMTINDLKTLMTFLDDFKN